MTTHTTPRLTSPAPQFLVDDLERAMAYDRDVLGFSFGGATSAPDARGTKDR